jgi:hypothetical protein
MHCCLSGGSPHSALTCMHGRAFAIGNGAIRLRSQVSAYTSGCYAPTSQSSYV